jgi:DNA-binding MarR family transcriptional regulator
MKSKSVRPSVRPSAPAGPADRGHLIGALLRLSHQALTAEVFGAMSATEYSDLQAMHMTALRPLWDAPDGLRATDLAAAARVTKQSMGAVLDQLEAAGYVERADDPTDRRAKIVRLTKRGRDAGKLLRGAVRRVEADWSRRIGAERLATVRSALEDLLASLDADRA